LKKNSTFTKTYLVVIMIIIYIPILLTVIYSFNEAKLTSVWDGFSLKWYQELFRDKDMAQALVNSLILAFLSCTLSVIIGTLGALGMHRVKRKSNNFIEYISTLPIMIPEIILGMVFLAVFSFMGLPFGLTTLVIAHTTFCVPYLFMMVKARLVGMDESIQDAARDLGASEIRVFLLVTLPMIRPAILSGMLLSFAMSFDDVVISIFVTGARVNTLPIKIYTKLKTGVTPEINALAAVMLAITIVIILAAEKIGKKKMA